LSQVLRRSCPKSWEFTHFKPWEFNRPKSWEVLVPSLKKLLVPIHEKSLVPIIEKSLVPSIENFLYKVFPHTQLFSSQLTYKLMGNVIINYLVHLLLKTWDKWLLKTWDTK
jgi:hypothetical protein